MNKRYTRVSRRSFLSTAALASGVGLSAAVIGACSSNEKATGAAGTPTMDMGGGSSGTPTPKGGMTWQEMDAMHKRGIEDFLANTKAPITKGKGNQPLEPKIESGVKVFDLTVDEVQWETVPGVTFKAFGYNNMLPGPVIRATEGDAVRVNVKNNLKESTTVHWHGLYVPNPMDGVPFINQPPIEPGANFTYEFTLRNSGTHMYHSHHNSLNQVNRGLLGAFIVDPKDRASYPAYDREYIMVLNDLNLGFTINGKGFPATDAVVAKKGEKVLVRFMNEGTMNHPMHLHGQPMRLVAKDGWILPAPITCDTVDVAPGNRWDAIIDATEVGAWAFHCHILTHAEGEKGMFGLVTALIVE
ncbi:MAG: copper oxidase [Dehalococcoidia bacterium]|nr:MAG: copper oxidase [Dehalococcoidia bacterium]